MNPSYVTKQNRQKKKNSLFYWAFGQYTRKCDVDRRCPQKNLHIPYTTFCNGKQ